MLAEHEKVKYNTERKRLSYFQNVLQAAKHYANLTYHSLSLNLDHY